MTERLTANQRRAILHGLVLSGLIFNAVLVVAWAPSMLIWVDVPSWRSIDLADLYRVADQSLTATGAFRFAPAVAWLMYPLALMPWPAFFVTFLSLNLASIAILGRRDALLLVLAFPPVLLELLNGNVHLLMAVAIWAGMRWPGAWSFLFLTKVTPGVGVAWFAGRREWRSLAIALGTTVTIVGVGWAIAPAAWADWFRSLLVSSEHQLPSPLPPLLLRVPVAAVLAWYAGRTNRAWLVPVACVIAMPTVWIEGLALLTACFPLWRERSRFERRGSQSGVGRTTTVIEGARA